MSDWVKSGCVCFVLTSCATNSGAPALKPIPIVRGVDSGVQQVVDNFFETAPDCGNIGYPETKIVAVPNHGTLAVKSGDVYPTFAKDNVRYECNKRKIASNQVLYESIPGFHGKDSFMIQVRYENSSIRLLKYRVDVL